VSELPDFNTIRDTMTLVDDWEEKYAYIIALGGKLPTYPEDKMDKAHEVPGCMSRVWMDYDWQGGTFNMRLQSDAVIVKGLLGILTSIYGGKTADQILATDPKAMFEALGLGGKLTQNRRDGFVAVANRIRTLAQVQTES